MQHGSRSDCTQYYQAFEGGHRELDYSCCLKFAIPYVFAEGDFPTFYDESMSVSTLDSHVSSSLFFVTRHSHM
jgi:hypothetical protein